MVLIPTTRNQAVALAGVVGDEGLNDEQIAAFRSLYRTTDDRSVAELVITGEIKPIADSDIRAFLKERRRTGISNRAELDHISAFLRAITDPVQISFLQAELPRILKGYLLKHLLGVLDEIVLKTAGTCSCGDCISDNSLCGLIGTPDCKKIKEERT